MRNPLLPLAFVAASLGGVELMSFEANAVDDVVDGQTEPPPAHLRFGPALAAERIRPALNPLQLVEARGQLLPDVQVSAYGGVGAHPLLAEAGEILTRRLGPWASGVYVTSVARTPEDQRRLMKERRTRGWAISRSKHLMGGMAIDIGYVSRRVSTWRLRDAAEEVLREELGEEKLSQLRVVRESHCVHVEIDTWTGRQHLDERIALLEGLGILRQTPEDNYPVPRLADYFTLEERAMQSQQTAMALAH